MWRQLREDSASSLARRPESSRHPGGTRGIRDRHHLDNELPDACLDLAILFLRGLEHMSRYHARPLRCLITYQPQ